MTVLVESYTLLERNKSSMPTCNECIDPPEWELKQVLPVDMGSLGYACSQHVHEVLYLVNKGLIELKTIPINLEEG